MCIIPFTLPVPEVTHSVRVLKVGLAADGTGAVDFVAAGTDLAVTFTAPTETTTTVYFFIAQGTDATGIVQAEKAASVAADYAAAYAALIDAAPAFTLSFEAVQ